IPLPHRVKSPPEQYAVSVRFGIAEGPAVFRVLLRSAPPVGVSWRMAYTMETSRTTIACLLVEYSSNWQNNMATNCPQLLKPRACRSALCLRAAVSNPVREMSCKICEKMLHTLFKAESSSDWFVFANSTYQRLSAFFFPKAIRSAELIGTMMCCHVVSTVSSASRTAILNDKAVAIADFPLPSAVQFTIERNVIVERDDAVAGLQNVAYKLTITLRFRVANLCEPLAQRLNQVWSLEICDIAAECSLL